MTKIVIKRHQYGVGQGGFHLQEISLAGKKSDKSSFRFVYDCGGKTDIVKWCIQHAIRRNQVLTLNAVYISHFEDDHVNGLEELCKMATVERLFVPYIDVQIAIHLIAKQIAAGVEITTEYVSTLFAVARGESIYDVPVTRIAPEGNESSPLDQSETTFEINPREIEADIPTRVTITNKDTIRLKTGKQKQIIWELVHWCYTPYPNLSATVLNKLTTKFPDFNKEILPGLLSGAKAAEANKSENWIQKHQRQIKDCYNEAFREVNRVLKGKSKIPLNHNVASLCLFSGPVPNTSRPMSFGSFSNISYHSCKFPCSINCMECDDFEVDCCCQGAKSGAWLSTGDAMLQRTDVWEMFVKFFDYRLNACATVVIPHHGANSRTSHNYNEALVKPRRNCVISAGATNGYHHPHISVVHDILEKGGILRLVSENYPLGFIEHLTFNI